MKKHLLILMGLFLFITAIPLSTASAADKSQVAVIDFTKVMTESDAGKKANADLAELIKTKKAGPEKLAQDYDKLKKELTDKAASLSDEEKKSKQEQLNQLAREYQKVVAQSNGEVQNKAQALKAQIFKEISEILKQVAKDKGYILIQDVTTLPYYDPSIDVTQEVIDRYNASKKSNS